MPVLDPDELFDLCTPDGAPTGRTKPRALVHRDGDWHRSLHVWVILTSTSPSSVLLQRRSLSKDTHPGKVDVSVAGHLRAGETVFDALREADEEIGLVVRPTELIRLGLRRRVDERASFVDREVQEVFCLLTTRRLETFRPDPDEVLGLLAVPLPDALGLVRGDVERAAALEVCAGDATPRPTSLVREDFLPDPDGYFALALASIVGAEQVPWSLGYPAHGR